MFSSGDITKIFGLTRAQLHKLILAGVLIPAEESTGQGVSNRFHIDDLLEICVVNRLLNLKLDIRDMKEIMGDLRKQDKWYDHKFIFIKYYDKKNRNIIKTVDLSNNDIGDGIDYDEEMQQLMDEEADAYIIPFQVLRKKLEATIKTTIMTPRGRKVSKQ